LFKGREEITQGLTYQWYTNEGNISGATNRTYVIEDINFNENGYIQYGCKITAELKEGT
jgi:hypothetical protein